LRRWEDYPATIRLIQAFEVLWCLEILAEPAGSDPLGIWKKYCSRMHLFDGADHPHNYPFLFQSILLARSCLQDVVHGSSLMVAQPGTGTTRPISWANHQYIVQVILPFIGSTCMPALVRVQTVLCISPSNRRRSRTSSHPRSTL